MGRSNITVIIKVIFIHLSNTHFQTVLPVNYLHLIIGEREKVNISRFLSQMYELGHCRFLCLAKVLFGDPLYIVWKPLGTMVVILFHLVWYLVQLNWIDTVGILITTLFSVEFVIRNKGSIFFFFTDCTSDKG